MVVRERKKTGQKDNKTGDTVREGKTEREEESERERD